ncbi:MAG: hypothetical protein NC548_39940 [Lachnospiraceae bacterium]|nr:hypothetical protein [Lachnospiraceae bacterium]
MYNQVACEINIRLPQNRRNMVRNEKELAKALLAHDSRIELHDSLTGGVSKIKCPSDIVWKSVAAALVTSAFFWGGPCAAAFGLVVGLPVVLGVCGGVGGVVFVTLGASGTLMAFRLLIASQTMDVLTELRDNYEMVGNVLTRK